MSEFVFWGRSYRHFVSDGVDFENGYRNSWLFVWVNEKWEYVDWNKFND